MFSGLGIIENKAVHSEQMNSFQKTEKTFIWGKKICLSVIEYMKTNTNDLTLLF